MLKNDISRLFNTNFRQILIYFFSFMHRGDMGFIAISESTHFCLSKIIFTFPPNFFTSLGIARQNMEKLSSDSSLGPIRVQTLANIFLKNESKSYLL